LTTVPAPELDCLTLVVLRRGPKADEFTDEELELLQEQHIAYQQAMRDRGAQAVAGPFLNQEDERLRGMSLWVVSLEEARELVEADPSVRAGRMAFDVMTWCVPKGTLAFPRLRGNG
jgi:uncharacterized protein YciI